MGHHHFLEREHRVWCNNRLFNGTTKTRNAPKVLISHGIYKQVHTSTIFGKYCRKKESHRRGKMEEMQHSCWFSILDFCYDIIQMWCKWRRRYGQFSWQLTNTEGKPETLLRLVRIYKKMHVTYELHTIPTEDEKILLLVHVIPCPLEKRCILQSIAWLELHDEYLSNISCDINAQQRKFLTIEVTLLFLY